MWPDRLGDEWVREACPRIFSTEAKTSVEFLSEGAHSEATRRRGQALAEERHLHFGKEDCCIPTRQGPLASAESKNSPSIFILHTTLCEGLEPRRSAAAAAAGELAIHPHPLRRAGDLPTPGAALPIGAPSQVIQCLLEGAPCTSECYYVA